MVRTHSSHTASPTRFRSPQHSPGRNPSQDGSQYEMDLDALGLNSTFETTELDGGHEPPVDRVDTSDIEGPEDFTMNMTYWMTADLPLAQIKSRKEAARRSGPRMDAMQESEEQDKSEGPPSKRPIITTTDEREPGRAPSERSMENEEKVRSFLSALPDTDMEGALTGTPRHAPRHSFLQVPQSSPPKARSLQPTVEDYDTPRKPTQATVIRHTSAIIDTSEQDVVRNHVQDLQSRLEQQEQQEQNCRTRITELETILSYTRTELDSARTDNYRHKEEVAALHRKLQEKEAGTKRTRASTDTQKQSLEDALTAQAEKLREEMRLQTSTKLQSQREEFGQEVAKLRSAKETADRELSTKELAMADLRRQLEQLQVSSAAQSKDVVDTSSQGSGGPRMQDQESITPDGQQTLEQLSSVQAQAEELQRDLEKALMEVRTAQKDAQHEKATRIAAEANSSALSSRISHLERHLQATRFEVECAQADVAAKQQLFNVNIDLNARLRTLQSELRTSRTAQDMDHQQALDTEELEQRTRSLQTQLIDLRADLVKKDQQIFSLMEEQQQTARQYNTAQGRIEGLEANQAIMRQQLGDSQREAARARTEAERLEHDLENAEESLREAQTDSKRRVADAEKRLDKLKEAKNEAESKYNMLQSQHDDLVEGQEAMARDIREKTEDAVRKAGAVLEQERSEKRRILKDLKNAREEADKLRSDAARISTSADSSDEDSDLIFSQPGRKAEDEEIKNLREIIRRQLTDFKLLKTEMAALKRENKKFKSAADASSDQHATITELSDEITNLRSLNSALELRLEEQRVDFEAINKAMDEKLAGVVSKVMKERAKMVVGKRDGQWAETVGRVQGEKELLGKVLLRQWGREEIGIADEKHGERQAYAYKYVQR
ncbi:hypothetical protein NX059_009983 [Plenodomus lindquistii]|nr:hypothetical protein NX059_009983 [Plenodomus lindquistii]